MSSPIDPPGAPAPDAADPPRAPRRWLRLPLRTKVALVASSLVFLLVGGTGVWQYRRLTSEYLSLLYAQQQVLTRIAAADLDYKLATHMDTLRREAREATAATFSDRARGQRFLARSELRWLFDGIGLIDLDGDVTANDPASSRQVNVGDRDYFRRARDGGENAISPPLRARTNDTPAVLMAVPARDDTGRLIGVVSAGLNLERPNALGGLGGARLGNGGYFVITTGGPDPVYVMHPDPQRLLRPVSVHAPQDTQQVDVSRDLITSAPVATPGWTLRVVLPAEQAYAPLRDARRALWLQMLALGLLSGLGVWVASAVLIRPLGALYEAIRQQRRDPDAAVALELSANDERGDLAREFDALMAELRQRRTELAALTDASPMGLFRCGVDGHMAYVNEAYLDLHGLGRQEVAKGWLGMVPAIERDAVWAAWLRRVRGAEPTHLRRWLIAHDGSHVLVSLHMRPVFENGQLVGQVGVVSDITERTRAEQAVRTLTAIFETTTDFVVQLDREGALSYLNPAARRCLGLDDGAPVTHLRLDDLLPEETRALMRDEAVPAALRDRVWVGVSMLHDAGGRVFPVSHMLIAHRDRHDRLERYSAIMRDISAQKATEQALQQSEARLRTMADALPMRVAFVDAQQRYHFVNRAYDGFFGRSREAFEGRTLLEVFGPEEHERIRPHVEAALAGRHLTVELEMRDGGHFACFQATYIPQTGPDGRTVLGFHAVTTDITAQKLEQERLRMLASRDPLTQLGNRAALQARVEHALAASADAGRQPGLVAVMYLDVDHFKQVNDSLGHHVGDVLLQDVARRLTGAVRPDDFVARIGGDEFVVLMEAIAHPDAARDIAHRVLRAFADPFEPDGHALRLGTSIGIAFHVPGTDDSAEALIRRADAMLYRAKGAGRNNVQVDEPTPRLAHFV